MGGLGSGWHRSSARLIERCEKIDLTDLKEHRATLEERDGVVLKSARSASGRFLKSHQLGERPLD